MGKQGTSPLHTKLIRGRKRLSKRKRRLQERLQKAHESKERAEERLQRMQARMQKRSARVQRLEERLRETRLQLQSLHKPGDTIALDISSAEGVDTHTEDIMIDVHAPEHLLNGAMKQQGSEDVYVDIMQSVDLATLAEAIVVAQDARYAADMAEDAARIALERVQSAEKRLDQSGMARHLEQEQAQMQQEVERALQFAYEKEQVARQAEQLIRPFKLLVVDEESESELCL